MDFPAQGGNSVSPYKIRATAVDKILATTNYTVSNNNTEITILLSS